MSFDKEEHSASVLKVETISTFKALHEFRSYRYIAENVRKDSQSGFALGVRRHVLITTQKIKLPSKESWRSILKREVDSVTCLISKYEYENSFVWNNEISTPRGKKNCKCKANLKNIMLDRFELY